jgi:hypothetical protein
VRLDGLEGVEEVEAGTESGVLRLKKERPQSRLQRTWWA